MSNTSFVDKYFQYAELLTENEPAKVSHFLETRTRQGDVTDAMRFRIYDPLWMLSRQWQLGEFRGNDAGTAMKVSCNLRQTKLSGFVYKDQEEPVEPVVESIDREVTPLVKVESAIYFLDILPDYVSSSDYDKIVQWVRNDRRFALENDVLEQFTEGSIQEDEVKAFTSSRNTRLMKFAKAFKGKIFDGDKLFCFLTSASDTSPVPRDLALDYSNWYERRYYAIHHSPKWDPKSLGHHFSVTSPARSFEARNYSGGNVSWHTFDASGQTDSGKYEEEKKVASLPTLATYASAPNKRLWQFEDRKVFMGNSTGMQAKGNVAVMQYATMYGNDWMLCPIDVQVGRYIDVSDITVQDTFGISRKISRRAGDNDAGAKTFGQKWQMYTNAPLEPDDTSSHSSNGFLFPPTLTKIIEGEPLEEVSLLRDEMANMVWGVENRVEDGCGSSMDASLLASEVGQFVEESYEKEVEKARLSVDLTPDGRAVMTSDREADYKYKLMTSVPFNWIPFVPQHIKTPDEKGKYSVFLGGRQTALRRGKMPCYFNGDYRPVRPLTSILKTNFKKKSDGSLGEVPYFIDEEQVQGVGTRIVKNCQRARWIGGKTYTWMGYSKQIKNTQGVSGLEFDNLTDNI